MGELIHLRLFVILQMAIILDGEPISQAFFVLRIVSVASEDQDLGRAYLNRAGVNAGFKLVVAFGFFPFLLGDWLPDVEKFDVSQELAVIEAAEDVDE